MATPAPGAADRAMAAGAGRGASALPLDAPPRQRQIVERYLQLLKEGEAAKQKEATP
jgi:hypothetical protein